MNITWSFDDDPTKVAFRAWYFTSSDGSFIGERLGQIISDGQFQPFPIGLSGVSIKKPATLLLKNVNQTYDGTYRFELAGPVGGRSEVVVYIASKLNLVLSGYYIIFDDLPKLFLVSSVYFRQRWERIFIKKFV